MQPGDNLSHTRCWRSICASSPSSEIFQAVLLQPQRQTAPLLFSLIPFDSYSTYIMWICFFFLNGIKLDSLIDLFRSSEPACPVLFLLLQLLYPVQRCLLWSRGRGWEGGGFKDSLVLVWTLVFGPLSVRLRLWANTNSCCINHCFSNGGLWPRSRSHGLVLVGQFFEW